MIMCSKLTNASCLSVGILQNQFVELLLFNASIYSVLLLITVPRKIHKHSEKNTIIQPDFHLIIHCTEMDRMKLWKRKTEKETSMNKKKKGKKKLHQWSNVLHNTYTLKSSVIQLHICLTVYATHQTQDFILFLDAFLIYTLQHQS